MLNYIVGFSQTGTCTVLQQPCNDDGVLVTTVTSGMVPPLTFRYIDLCCGTVHSNVNALTDTFTGYSSYWVSISDNYQHYLTLITGMVNPFSVDYPVVTNANCPSSTGTALITINSGAMPDSVHWFNNISFVSLVNFANYYGSGNPANLPVGNYGALIFFNSCSAIKGDTGLAIYNNSPITFLVNTTTASCTNGTASVSNFSGGIAPYTFQWSNGANTQTINNLAGGQYRVTVTDAQGCYKVSNWINVPQSPTISVNSTATPATCLQNDGSVISFGSGGSPPYTYLFSNGATGQTASGLSVGTNIYVTATDANGCKGTGYKSVSGSTPITATYTTTPSSCTASTGSATLNISGGTLPYSIIWTTFPPQNGTSINNMPAGSYSFKVTDAVGCVRSGTAVIPPQSTINASVTVTNAVCPGNTGNINANVSGSNPPYAYSWNNGSTVPMLSSVPLGSYTCTITDNVGCSVVKHGQVNLVSTIGIGFNTSPASCMYTNDGSIIANAYGGIAPYSYQWSNGQTGSNIDSLASGNYWVNVTDNIGCVYSGCDNHTFVDYDLTNDSCYCTIQGKVYVDLNGNCQYDSGEQGVEHVMMHCAPFGYAYTDSNGDYSFTVPTGTYTLSEIVQYFYPLATCQNNAVSVSVVAVSGCVSTVNFANIVNPLHDIHIIPTSTSGPPIPGFSYTQGLIVQNDGTISENDIQFGYRNDGQLQYASSFPNVFTQLSPTLDSNWYSVTAGFPALLPGASTMLKVNYNVPANIPLGTAVVFEDTAVSAMPMSSWLSDYSPWNNVNQYQQTVVGSYDPNYKEVFPKGEGTLGLINPSDSVLDYVIHFQNMGTYYAENIVVTDTLDADLDWTSVRPGYADHEYVATMDENGVLKFTFNNIHLDWKAHNEYNSKGLVTYSVKIKPNLSNGTEILNAANIFFDFNSPVITDTTINTISGVVVSIEKHNENISIYPNPTSGVLNIVSANISEISIYDISGRLVIKEEASSEPTQKISVEKLKGGVYLIEILKVNGGKVHGKFVKN